MKHAPKLPRRMAVMPHSTVRVMSGLFCALALTVLTPASAQAQAVYRIVGPDGRVTFSDKPPVTPGTTAPQAGGARENASGGQSLPYELQQVVDKYPVTLYTSKDCAPCDSGRSLLRTRGVPFSEKTVTTAEDAEALQRLSATSSLPVLAIGGQQIKGYSDAEWHQYLGLAGYPDKTRLPAGYRNPAPSPLVAVQAPVVESARAASAPDTAPKPQAPATPPRVSPTNPAGIQF